MKCWYVFLPSKKSKINVKFQHKIISKVTPLGRSADPKELDAVFLLLADVVTGSFITGACWVVDGGMAVFSPSINDIKF